MNGRGFNLQDFVNRNAAPMPIRPASVAPDIIVGVNQWGAVEEADPTAFVTSKTANCTAANSATRKRAFFRFARPITSYRWMLAVVGSCVINITGTHAVLQLEGIGDADLDLDTVNWNNQGGLTYVSAVSGIEAHLFVKTFAPFNESFGGKIFAAGDNSGSGTITSFVGGVPISGVRLSWQNDTTYGVGESANMNIGGEDRFFAILG